MINDVSIKVKNYKCFGDEPQGFERIYPINIIIGKNNSGKSTLLELIEYAINPSKGIPNPDTQTATGSEVILSALISEEIINQVFPDSISGGGLPGVNHRAYGKTLIGSKVEYALLTDFTKKPVTWDKSLFAHLEKNDNRGYFQPLFGLCKNPFQGLNFRKINAERDIKPENSKALQFPTPTGDNATSFVYAIINEGQYDRRIIEKEFLTELNKVTQPDIAFSEIVIEYDNTGAWEIKLLDSSEQYIPLSKMGSGIKTVVLVLLNLIAIPRVTKSQSNSYVFAFEELENNLHPSLLRRLFNYIADYSKKNGCYFFITTHSSIAIDLFSLNEDSQIIHLVKENDKVYINSISEHKKGGGVLKDLGVRPSDILLSNGVLWVEGPSDVIYLETLLLLAITNKSYKHKLNYSIQALSTAVWKYAGFSDFSWEKIESLNLENHIISLTKLNHNHLVILDKDDNYEDLPPSKWESFINGNGKNKARLLYESMKYSEHTELELESNTGDTKDGKLFFWITEGTFESYLSHFIKNKGKKFDKYFERNATRDYFEKKRTGNDHTKSKVELAAEITKFILESNLTIHDLAPKESHLLNKIERLIATIKFWNNVD